MLFISRGKLVLIKMCPKNNISFLDNRKKNRENKVLVSMK